MITAQKEKWSVLRCAFMYRIHNALLPPRLASKKTGTSGNKTLHQHATPTHHVRVGEGSPAPAALSSLTCSGFYSSGCRSMACDRHQLHQGRPQREAHLVLSAMNNLSWHHRGLPPALLAAAVSASISHAPSSLTRKQGYPAAHSLFALFCPARMQLAANLSAVF